MRAPFGTRIDKQLKAKIVAEVNDVNRKIKLLAEKKGLTWSEANDFILIEISRTGNNFNDIMKAHGIQ